MDNEKWGQFSIEFCGGTHLSNTSEAQLFTIVSEEPVSMARVIFLLLFAIINVI